VKAENSVADGRRRERIPSTIPPDVGPLAAPPPPDDLDGVWSLITDETRARSNAVHLPISFAFAGRLCDAHPEADRDVVRVSVMLHDTGWARIDEGRIIEGFRGDWRHSAVRFEHERHSCDIARDVLHRLGYSLEFIERVTDIIDGHDTRELARSLEDSLVRDADRLWRFTVAGIALASGWFGRTPAEYCARLRTEIVPELLTEAGLEMALAELTRSERLLRTDLLP
jgi:hypothetical protein